MSLADEAHRRLRAQQWQHSEVWWAVGGPLGRPYTQADVIRAAHRQKAWQRAQRWLEARGRIPRRGGEEEVEVPQGPRRRRRPPRWSPWDPLRNVRWDLHDEEVPPEEWTDYVEENLPPWEAAGTLEGGPPVPAAVLPGGVVGPVVLDEVGETRMVELQLPATSSRAAVSVGVGGPVAVERWAAWLDSAGAVKVQVVAVPAGAGVSPTAPAGSLSGQPLVQVVDPTGAATGVVDLFGSGTFFEVWPRRVIPMQSVAFAVAATNDEISGRRLVVAVDVRGVRPA
jgi:hypothetical protein